MLASKMDGWWINWQLKAHFRKQLFTTRFIYGHLETGDDRSTRHACVRETLDFILFI